MNVQRKVKSIPDKLSKIVLRVLTTILLVMLLSVCKQKTTVSSDTAFASLQGMNDETLFRTITRELSDDSFGGREPLTPYEAPTIEYIANRFKEVGLEPAAGGSYFQKVPLLSVKTHLKNNEITVNGTNGVINLRSGNDVVIWTLHAEKQLKVEDVDFVFAGFGIYAPEYGWDDYAGIDVKGKVVVVMVNDPGFFDENLFRGKNMTYYGRWTYKFEEAGRRGAAAALIIHDTEPASYGWSVVQNSRTSPTLTLNSETGNRELIPFQGWVTGDAAQKLFDAAGVSLSESLAAAKKKGFRSFPLNLKTTIESTNDIVTGESANVAAIIPGTSLKDEYIVYTGHWDHLGIGQPVDGDSIYNGASDNATGIAALIMLGRRFKELPEPPKRSIVFLAVTAEESGLLGSRYYSENPLFPLEKTAVCLNMDSYGDRMRTYDVILSAPQHSETDRYVIDAAAAQGRTVTYSYDDPSGTYYRSDHINFARKGVPVVLAKGGTEYINPEAARAYLAKYHDGKDTYHQPSDEYFEWWDLSGAFEDIYLFYAIGLRLANESYFPKWNDGAEFKAVRDQSANYR